MEQLHRIEQHLHRAVDLPVWVLPVAGMFSIVQSIVTGSIQYPASNTLTANVSVGNRLIVIMAHSYLNCPPSVSDSLGNTWTFHGTQLTDGASSKFLEVFSAPVTVGGSCIITRSAGCGTAYITLLTEVSGLHPTSAYEGEAINYNNTSTLLSGNVTTTQSGSLIIGIFSAGGGNPTLTPNTETQIGAPTEAGSIAEYKRAGLLGAYNLTATGAGVDFAAFRVFGGVAAFQLNPENLNKVGIFDAKTTHVNIIKIGTLNFMILHP